MAAEDAERAERREAWSSRLKRSFSRQLTSAPDLDFDSGDPPELDTWRHRPDYFGLICPRPPLLWTCDLRGIEVTPLREWLLWHWLAPIRFSLALTVPDSRKAAAAHRFPAAFALSVAWIAVLSYVMVWMVCPLPCLLLGVGEEVGLR